MHNVGNHQGFYIIALGQAPSGYRGLGYRILFGGGSGLGASIRSAVSGLGFRFKGLGQYRGLTNRSVFFQAHFLYLCSMKNPKAGSNYSTTSRFDVSALFSALGLKP